MTNRGPGEAFSIRRDTPEWAALWDCLSREVVARGLGAGGDLAQRNNGEVWEYAGSFKRPDGSVSHSFRHRAHPKTRARESFDVPALPAP